MHWSINCARGSGCGRTTSPKCSGHILIEWIWRALVHSGFSSQRGIQGPRSPHGTPWVAVHRRLRRCSIELFAQPGRAFTCVACYIALLRIRRFVLGVVGVREGRPNRLDLTD